MRAPIEYVTYPPTSFPLRDLLVLEHLDLRPCDVVAEIGVGSGATSARLARLCASVTGIDVSPKAIASLAYLLRRRDNLHLAVGDATKPETLHRYDGAFTRVVSCDTLEHVADPAAYFATIQRTLAPGGRFLVTFPNEPRERMHGVTRFDTPASLEAFAARAGLTHLRAGAVHLAPGAARIADLLGYRAVGLVRRLLGGRRSRPQTFEETTFHARSATWRKLAPAINLYWFAVLRMMAREGTCVRVDWGFRSTEFRSCQVLLVGARPTVFEERLATRMRHTLPRTVARAVLPFRPAPASARATPIAARERPEVPVVIDR